MRRFAESGDDALRLAIKCEARVQACSVNTRAGVWSHARVYSRSIRGRHIPACAGVDGAVVRRSGRHSVASTSLVSFVVG